MRCAAGSASAAGLKDGFPPLENRIPAISSMHCRECSVKECFFHRPPKGRWRWLLRCPSYGPMPGGVERRSPATHCVRRTPLRLRRQPRITLEDLLPGMSPHGCEGLPGTGPYDGRRSRRTTRSEPEDCAARRVADCNAVRLSGRQQGRKVSAAPPGAQEKRPRHAMKCCRASSPCELDWYC